MAYVRSLDYGRTRIGTHLKRIFVGGSTGLLALTFGSMIMSKLDDTAIVQNIESKIESVKEYVGVIDEKVETFKNETDSDLTEIRTQVGDLSEKVNDEMYREKEYDSAVYKDLKQQKPELTGYVLPKNDSRMDMNPGGYVEFRQHLRVTMANI